MNDTAMYEYMLHDQFNIPKRLNYLAEQYGLITWKEVQHLYNICVEEVLMEFNLRSLNDGSFGYYYKIVEERFIKRLIKLNKEKEQK